MAPTVNSTCAKSYTRTHQFYMIPLCATPTPPSSYSTTIGGGDDVRAGGTEPQE